MATHSFSSRHYSSPLPFSATLSNSKADRIKAFLLPRIAYHRRSYQCYSKAFLLKSIPLPIQSSLLRCGFKSLLTLAIPGLLISSMWYAIPLLFHAFPMRSSSELFPCFSQPNNSLALPSIAFPTLVCRKSADKACNLFNG